MPLPLEYVPDTEAILQAVIDRVGDAAVAHVNIVIGDNAPEVRSVRDLQIKAWQDKERW